MLALPSLLACLLPSANDRSTRLRREISIPLLPSHVAMTRIRNPFSAPPHRVLTLLEDAKCFNYVAGPLHPACLLSSKGNFNSLNILERMPHSKDFKTGNRV